MTALPKKNQTVTLLLATDVFGGRKLLTAVVATVSRTHGEFTVIIGGRPQWFGPESVVGL